MIPFCPIPSSRGETSRLTDACEGYRAGGSCLPGMRWVPNKQSSIAVTVPRRIAVRDEMQQAASGLRRPPFWTTPDGPNRAHLVVHLDVVP